MKAIQSLHPDQKPPCDFCLAEFYRQLNKRTAMNICEARAAYDYPTSHIRFLAPDCADDQLIYVEACGGKSEQSEYQFNSTLSLDKYHYKLLNSENAEENRIGIASVIYWGTYYIRQSPNHGLAFYRTNQFLKITQDVVAPLSGARREINSNNYGMALKEILSIERLGIAFGTKVLAFLNPYKVGVYDLHISRSIKNPSLKMVPKGHYSKEKEKVFNGFCHYLNSTALELNSSRECKWKDRDGKLHCWRSVDVERAMFYLA